MDFEPALLRAFIAVTEAGGFTRAAQRLHLTQSAVSHQIRRLEQQAGRPLLQRTTRSLTLTEDGHDFLGHARIALDALDALTRRFQTSAVAGVLRFGVPETFMGERLPALLGQFSRDYPAVRLDVQVGTYLDLRAMAKAGELDLAVVLGEADAVAAADVLRRTHFIWAAADGFAAAPGASLPLALSPPPCVNRSVAELALAATALSTHIAFTSPSAEGIRAAVLAGLGVTVQLPSDLTAGMRCVDGEYGLPPLPAADFVLVWRGGDKSPAARAFGELLQSMTAASGRRRRGHEKSLSAAA
ncbi:LysR family transcriptional regulator [Rugamonas sp. CCM 8940]|uniref:LysR family transcriptional regulator n=1 Tax=Rugamonas sp. CCM 8940 TaxID=2765359 RepID=UPI0018F67BCA|nr:LysR family transcriptional regulator [Rugamonas sp. CCM 8940]MBJ7313969.1 LysR family transcriptional regulator [Rugamonas sp. CCM 8940]